MRDPERDNFMIANVLLLGADLCVWEDGAAPLGWTTCILGNRVLYRATTKGEAAEGALSTLGFSCLAEKPYELVHSFRGNSR